MKIRNFLITLGLSLTLGISATAAALSNKHAVAVNAFNVPEGYTQVTAENSSSFVGGTAYVIGSNTTYGLTSSGNFGKSGDLLELTIESASGSSLVLKRNDTGKYLNNPCNGSWSDSSVTRYINSSNGGLSQNTNASNYWWAVKFPGEATIYYENHNEDSMGTQQSIFYVYAAATPVVLELKVNDMWASDGARFAAYFYGKGEETTWVNMSLVSGSTQLYEVEAPAGFPNVIFCRMNGNNPLNDWSNTINQTGDLNVADGSYYLMYDDSWDTGVWYDGTDVVYIEGTFTVPSWGDFAEYQMSWNRLTGQYEFFTFGLIYENKEFKVYDKTTKAWAGYASEGMTNDYSMFHEGSDNNIVVDKETYFDVYYKPLHNKLWIEESALFVAYVFANEFNTITGGVCVDSSKSSGDTDVNALAAVWNVKETPDGTSLVEKWNALTIGAKAKFVSDTDIEEIVNARARYEHIMSRYSASLTEFINGPEFVVKSINLPFNGGYNTTNDSIMIIIIIAVASLALTTSILIVKKRHR